jgi:hypothetical protein
MALCMSVEHVVKLANNTAGCLEKLFEILVLVSADMVGSLASIFINKWDVTY